MNNENLKTGGPKTLELDSSTRCQTAHSSPNRRQIDGGGIGCTSGRQASTDQRYEASDYQTANVARLLEIARVLNLRVRESVQLVQS